MKRMKVRDLVTLRIKDLEEELVRLEERNRDLIHGHYYKETAKRLSESKHLLAVLDGNIEAGGRVQ